MPSVAEPRSSPAAARVRLLPRGGNAASTCRYFGISRQAFYGRKRRYDRQELGSLEERSHQPHRRRQPTWWAGLAERVLAPRGQYPRRGKDKLAVLPGRAGRVVPTSRVGRILRRLRQRGLQRFVLPPPSPKLNGAVERLQRTHTEEFYEVTPCALQTPLNQELLDRERTYNTLRPHQTLGYRNPRSPSPKRAPNLSASSVTNPTDEYISLSWP